MASLIVTDALSIATKSGKVNWLLLLDISLAFDTIDHKIFLDQLKPEIQWDSSKLVYILSLSHAIYTIRKNAFLLSAIQDLSEKGQRHCLLLRAFLGFSIWSIIELNTPPAFLICFFGEKQLQNSSRTFYINSVHV